MGDVPKLPPEWVGEEVGWPNPPVWGLYEGPGVPDNPRVPDGEGGDHWEVTGPGCPDPYLRPVLTGEPDALGQLDEGVTGLSGCQGGGSLVLTWGRPSMGVASTRPLVLLILLKVR